MAGGAQQRGAVRAQVVHRHLLESEIRTLDPVRAQLFFIPAYLGRFFNAHWQQWSTPGDAWDIAKDCKPEQTADACWWEKWTGAKNVRSPLGCASALSQRCATWASLRSPVFCLSRAQLRYSRSAGGRTPASFHCRGCLEGRIWQARAIAALGRSVCGPLIHPAPPTMCRRPRSWSVSCSRTCAPRTRTSTKATARTT